MSKHDRELDNKCVIYIPSDCKYFMFCIYKNKGFMGKNLFWVKLSH